MENILETARVQDRKEWAWLLKGHRRDPVGWKWSISWVYQCQYPGYEKFYKMLLLWKIGVRAYGGSLCIVFYNCTWIYNYLKMKSLIKTTKITVESDKGPGGIHGGVSQPTCSLIWFLAFPPNPQNLSQSDSVLRATHQGLWFLKFRDTQALFTFHHTGSEKGVADKAY